MGLTSSLTGGNLSFHLDAVPAPTIVLVLTAVFVRGDCEEGLASADDGILSKSLRCHILAPSVWLAETCDAQSDTSDRSLNHNIVVVS